MFSAEIEARANARNDEVLLMVLNSPSVKPRLDLARIELLSELAMLQPGLRKDRLRKKLIEHFGERFGIDALQERFGFENTG